MRWVVGIALGMSVQARAQDTFQLFETDCIHETDIVDSDDTRPDCDQDTDVATVDTSRFVYGDAPSAVAGEDGGPACASTGSAAWPGLLAAALVVVGLRRQLGRR